MGWWAKKEKEWFEKLPRNDAFNLRVLMPQGEEMNLRGRDGVNGNDGNEKKKRPKWKMYVHVCVCIYIYMFDEGTQEKCVSENSKQ